MSDCPRCKNPLRDCICGSEADKETLAFFVREYESAKQNEVTILEREVSNLQSQLAARDAEIAAMRNTEQSIREVRNKLASDLIVAEEEMARRRLERRVVPQFAYKHGLVTATHYHRVYRDDKHGFQLEVITRRSAAGFPTGKGKTYFFIDGIKTEFRTEAAMLKHFQKMTAAVKSNG